MPRQARIDQPGLLQHVICRGIERSQIFLSDGDREDFLRRLRLLLLETRTACYAWVLLDNHVHLLLLPTATPLAVFMRRLLTGYAVVFNRRHQRSGHLFQNRYKSIVCDSDAYSMELIRYIHLNPVRAGIVADLDALADYRWCAHRQMLGRGEDHLVLEHAVLALFGRSKEAARVSYLQFLADGLRLSLPQLSQGGRRASQMLDGCLTDDQLYDDRILGGGGFVERILTQEQSAVTPKSLDSIAENVAKHYGIDVEELTWPSKVRMIAEAKAVICFLATCRHRLSGAEVGKVLGYTPSAVSRAAKRGRLVVVGMEHFR
jgi:REP element-mobilizing transposase RayT